MTDREVNLDVLIRIALRHNDEQPQHLGLLVWVTNAALVTTVRQYYLHPSIQQQTSCQNF